MRTFFLLVLFFLVQGIHPLAADELALICPNDVRMGDFNADNLVDLSDVIVGLQVQVGAAVWANKKADVNGDGKLGMVDIMFSLHQSSGLLPEPKNILFAHGMNSQASHWEFFAQIAKYQAHWNVFCTDVTPDGSIATRGGELAQFIDDLELETDSLVALAHSMGGLDLRHIVTEGHENPLSTYGLAADSISEIFTIATPHKGHPAGGFPISDAIEDLGLASMLAYNRTHPYSEHVINSRQVPLTALRFACTEGDLNGEDGVVAVASQNLSGAPHTVVVYEGGHTPDDCGEGVQTELGQYEEVLVPILDGSGFDTAVYDIVFYEGNDCGDGEKGSFSSRDFGVTECNNAPLEISPNFNLPRNNMCDNDEIRSVKIFPGSRSDTRIRVYDNASGITRERLSDDWSAINLGNNTIVEAKCIDSFEVDHTDNDDTWRSSGMAMYNKQGPDTYVDSRLDGKISKVVISDSSLASVHFYEGANCRQGLKAVFDAGDGSSSVHEDCMDPDADCDNDEIRSVLITPGVATGTIVKTYDDRDGSLSDDWFFLNRGSDNLDVPFCVNGMEHNTSGREGDAGIATFSRERNGLNGKVSYVKISREKDSKFVFYEATYCGQDVKGLFEAGGIENDYNIECNSYSGNGTCQNDEVSSVLIQPGVLEGKDIRVFDDKDGDFGDDYTSIYRGHNTLDTPFCINGFEHDTTSGEEAVGIQVNYHPNNGLNGKVSRIRVLDTL